MSVPDRESRGDAEQRMPGTPVSWLARLALAIYPPAFRQRYGAELAHTWRRMDAHARRRGMLARIGWRAAAAADVVTSAGAEWLDAMAVPVPSHSTLQHDRPLTRESSPMSALLFDLRTAARTVARRPGLAAAVIITLALGIGANTAIFGLIDAVLLHPLPVSHPDELVRIYQSSEDGAPKNPSSYPAYQALARDNRAFRGVAAYYSLQVSMQERDESLETTAGVVSANYFHVLGLRPQVGRLFAPDDAGAPGSSPIVVLGDGLWERLYHRDPAVVGTTIRVGPTNFRVIGVAPRGFRGVDFASSPEVWCPLEMVAYMGAGGFFGGKTGQHVLEMPIFPWLNLVGRLAPGMTPVQATVELERLYDTRVRTLPALPARLRTVRSSMNVAPAVEAAVVGDREGLVRFVRLLVAVVVLTLALACVNVANLLLVRWSERARELGVRLALGASRARVVRQLFFESLILAGSGGLAALAVALMTIRLLTVFTLPGRVALDQLDLALGWRVLAFTAATAVLTALAFGVVPAIRSSRASLMEGLRRQTGQTGGGGSRAVLLGLQVAITLVLLTGAGLFLRSVRAGLHSDLGFDPAPLAAASVQASIHGYDGPRAALFADAVLQRLTSMPGVAHAAVATHVPLGPANMLPWSVGPAPTDPSPALLAGNGASLRAGINGVTPGYFATLGVRIVEGRDFASTDASNAPKVAIVNEAAARHFWPGADPVGKELRTMGVLAYRVVGVARTTKYETLQDHDAPFVFVPFAQSPFSGTISIVARSSRPAVALSAIGNAIRATDRSMPVGDARLVRRQMDAVLMPQRFGATLLTIFAVLGLVVAAAGIYGTVRSTAARRLPEIGVRIALGASPADIVILVGRATVIAVSAGLIAGLAASAAMTRLVSSFLYGVPALDPVAFAGAALVLATTALGVSLVPARRASRTDPVRSMRAT